MWRIQRLHIIPFGVIFFSFSYPLFRLLSSSCSSSKMLLRAIQEAFVRSVARFLRTRPDLIDGNPLDLTVPLHEADWRAQVSTFLSFFCLRRFTDNFCRPLLRLLVNVSTIVNSFSELIPSLLPFPTILKTTKASSFRLLPKVPSKVSLSWPLT